MNLGRGLAIAAAAIALPVAGVLAVAATKPGTLSIRRSASIAASPETIFGLVADLHQWRRWAPQDLDDETMLRTFSGAESGVGAASDWQSNGSAGAGRMTIVHAVAPANVTIEVDFVRPFVARNVNEFAIEEAAGTTTVSWSMRGTNPFIAKVMSVFVDLDGVMGEHFETGLANLKAIAEA